MSLPGRLLDLPFGRLFVHRVGEGPPLVLLHGFLVSHYYFDKVVPELAKRFDVIALDLPGHGESDRPAPGSFDYSFAGLGDAVMKAVDQLGVGKFRLWGHSMGGGVATALVARHRDRVERLLLEDPLLFPLPLSLEGRLALLPGLGPLLFKRIYSKRDLTKHLRSAYRDPSLATPELMDYYWERFNRAGSRVALYAMLRNIGAVPLRNEAAESLDLPTLIAWGDSDVLVPAAQGERAKATIRNSRLEIIKDCGHSPHEERPDEILKLAIPFLEGTA